MQHQDGHEAADDAVDDERDIAAERHDAQRDHGAHPEGREHQGGRHIARDFDHHTRSLRWRAVATAELRTPARWRFSPWKLCLL